MLTINFMKEKKFLQPRASFRQRIILILFGISLCFVLLEVGLRFGGFIFLSFQEYLNKISIRQNKSCRILCLGDSVTAFGGKYSWPAQLEKILNDTNTGITFSVINKGVPGASSYSILSLLNDHIKRYNPHIVITMMGTSDGNGIMKYYEDKFYWRRSIKQNNIVLLKELRIFFLNLRVYKLAKLLSQNIVNNFNTINKSSLKIMAEFKKPNFVGARNTAREKNLLKKVAMTPGDSNLYLELGTFYSNDGREDEAERMLKKALDLDPSGYRANFILGDYYSQHWIFDEAEKLLQKAIEINPEDYRAYLSLSRVLVAKREYGKTELILKKGIELNSNVPFLYLNLANCYLQQQGREKEAEPFLIKTMEIAPNNVLALAYLGRLYIIQERFSEAEQMLKKAINIDPGSGPVKQGLEECYQKQRKFKEKVDMYEASVDNYRDLEEIICTRGIRLVCVQYAMCSVSALKNIFRDKGDIIFVDNEKLFKEAVAKEGYKKYFIDKNISLGFGHCTPEGNRLLAENVANTILKEIFHK
jgi:tetratricopeptide (TPR) repeat protein